MKIDLIFFRFLLSCNLRYVCRDCAVARSAVIVLPEAAVTHGLSNKSVLNNITISQGAVQHNRAQDHVLKQAFRWDEQWCKIFLVLIKYFCGCSLLTSILYSLRTALFRPEDDELGQLVVGVSCRVIKPACPPYNGVAVVPLLLQKMSSLNRIF